MGVSQSYVYILDLQQPVHEDDISDSLIMKHLGKFLHLLSYLQVVNLLIT